MYLSTELPVVDFEERQVRGPRIGCIETYAHAQTR